MRPTTSALAFAVVLIAGASASAQDFQVGARAKAMGGSYTAFGDDPVAVWINPAGTAGQPSQFAITYQSFTEYQFDHIDDQIPLSLEGAPSAGLLDPPISPSFAGIVVQIGDRDLEMAVSLAYIRPFQIKYVYFFNGSAIGDQDLFTQTDQQFSRIRVGYAVNFKISDSSSFLKRVALGVGFDFVYTKYKEIDQNVDPNRDTEVFEDSESGPGFGLGLLSTIYESSGLRVDAGATYNSAVNFHFGLDKNVFPVWDWPALASAGLAFYLFENYPLLITLDTQWIGWKRAVGSPDPTLGGFENTVSYSAGAEYRVPLKTGLWLYPRVGWKSYDTPWEGRNTLPALGLSQLRIKTKGDRIEILTTGLGLYWSRKTWEGETRLSGIDLAAEFFGDAKYLLGLGFTYQFD